MLGRLMPWNPSQPPMKSHSISSLRPPTEANFGFALVTSCRLTSLDLEQNLTTISKSLCDQILMTPAGHRS
jgi:hypothetical protein